MSDSLKTRRTLNRGKQGIFPGDFFVIVETSLKMEETCVPNDLFDISRLVYLVDILEGFNYDLMFSFGR